jgi:transposase InsO family protein
MDAFLDQTGGALPGKVEKVLTDNGSSIKAANSRGLNIVSPQTNGMVERFNRCIADILKTTRFQSS